jgi:hypothetical protein
VGDKQQEVSGGTMPWWRKRWVSVTAGTVAVVLLGLFATAEYVLHNMGPIVRKRVIETLSARFHAPVELDDLQISLLHGVEVQGRGLRVPYGAAAHAPSGPQGGAAQGSPMQTAEGQLKPLISADSFTFHTTFKGLWRTPTHIGVIHLDGLELHLPPGPDRGKMLGMNNGEPADPLHPKTHAKIAFSAIEIVATNVKLVLETDKPNKVPLEFDINKLRLLDVDSDLPMKYEAHLINPKPVGEINAHGHFGPWNADNPRETPVDGDYSFDHADLNSIKGLGGTLSSTGHYQGVLDRITIDGTTDTPDFSLDISGHPVPLKTVFHAYVDGTTGDTTLDPVNGKLRNSDILASGKIENIKGQGHDISLDAVLTHARMEDVLDLGVKTRPALMRGSLTMKTHIHIPPGKERVAAKLELSNASMKIQSVVFQNTKWQDKIDGLSMRAQGKPEDAKNASQDKVAEVNSQMSLDFKLGHGQIYVDNLDYEIPGAHVLMNGVYSMDGKLFEFKGHVRTDAKPSQMVTGWKSILLMPVDKFVKKNGAGMELPIAVSGTQDDVHFGLAMHGTSNDTSAQIGADMKGKKAK